MMDAFEASRRFVYRNARPLDLARWQYHFEGAPRENVVKALACYQNPDGGFGHALEPDFWNPASSPIATWAATEILREVGVTSGGIIDSILAYLGSGADYDGERGQWLNTVPGNNDYPRAVWWEYKEDGGQFMYNPTACLAGFILRFAEKGGNLYEKGCEIARRAFEYFAASVPLVETHVTGCFIRLYEYCTEAGAELFDMERFKSLLIDQVNHNICRDTEKWGTEYVARPCDFFNSRDSIFYPDNRDAAEHMCEFFVKAQLADGSYPVTWKWWTDWREFEIAANWWKGSFAVANMLYLHNFGKI